jgi:hypothetical protein
MSIARCLPLKLKVGITAEKREQARRKNEMMYSPDLHNTTDQTREETT